MGYNNLDRPKENMKERMQKDIKGRAQVARVIHAAALDILAKLEQGKGSVDNTVTMLDAEPVVNMMLRYSQALWNEVLSDPNWSEADTNILPGLNPKTRKK